MTIRHRSLLPGALVVACLSIVSSAVADEPASSTAWAKIAPHFTPPAEFAGDTGGYASPLKFYDGEPVETAEQWPKRRAEILKAWHQMLGPGRRWWRIPRSNSSSRSSGKTSRSIT